LHLCSAFFSSGLSLLTNL